MKEEEKKVVRIFLGTIIEGVVDGWSTEYLCAREYMLERSRLQDMTPTNKSDGWHD